MTHQPSRGVAVDREQRALAHVEAVAVQLRSEFWFSHESAALIWGCSVVGLDGKTHVTQEWHASRRGDDALVRHVIELPATDRTRHRGLPVTTLERTVIDCASSLPGRRALVVLDSALRLGADPELIARLLGARSARRGVRRARSVIVRGDAGAESPGESLTRWEILEAGLPRPACQLEVTTRLGVFRLDIAWPAAKVAVEFDGFVKYSGGFGSAADVVFAEKRRQDALESAGWLIIRVTWQDLNHPEGWIPALHSALVTRTARADH